jgi:hypothetical protein
VISEATRRYVRDQLVEFRAERDRKRRLVAEYYDGTSILGPPRERYLDWNVDAWDAGHLWGL